MSCAINRIMAAELYSFALLSQYHNQYKSYFCKNVDFINDATVIYNKYGIISIAPIYIDSITLFKVLDALNESLEVTITKKNIEELMKAYDLSEYCIYKKVRNDVNIIMFKLSKLLKTEETIQISIKKYKKLFQVDNNIHNIMNKYLN